MSRFILTKYQIIAVFAIIAIVGVAFILGDMLKSAWADTEYKGSCTASNIYYDTDSSKKTVSLKLDCDGHEVTTSDPQTIVARVQDGQTTFQCTVNGREDADCDVPNKSS